MFLTNFCQIHFLIKVKFEQFSASQRPPPYPDPFVISHARYHKTPRIYPLVATPAIPFIPYRRYPYCSEVPETHRHYHSADWTSSPRQVTRKCATHSGPKCSASDLNIEASALRKRKVSAGNGTELDPVCVNDRINETFEVLFAQCERCRQ
ncbi:hypothetical protein KIN20_036001 [Parelaphostrongylus tenuis]|uniref:Uncharacterized protein n=1 Tax=Parelaphostrongylus tenuis TaxID=148309 RepID=A0AAD5WKZ9_PARTN|nr:hypothetical protein KIN20_036001 [Parelaphostrongylus tenuis]